MSGSTVSVEFQDFGLQEYRTFLRAKGVPEFRILLDDAGIAHGLSVPARFAHMLDMAAPVNEGRWRRLPDFLFQDQREILRMALDAERFAVWSDCGLGKTLIELEFARQVSMRTRGRVLIITLADVVPEIVREAAKFYGRRLPVRILRSREEMRQWCADAGQCGVAVTNYEKMNPEGGPETQVVREMRHLAGLVLDESSRLKTGGGKQKWALIHSAKGIRYKLSATATPAPNEVMEFACQASFLERIRGEAEVMWTYFARDPRTQEWTVKEHARPHFFRWMASWSIYVRDPAAYGWPRNAAAVPEPDFYEYRIPATEKQRELALEVVRAESTKTAAMDDMFASHSLGMVGRNILSQIAKGFRYHGKDVERLESNKPAYVADLIRSEVAQGLQVLCWCLYDAEVDILMEKLRAAGVPAVSLGGKDSKEGRLSVLSRFRKGLVPVLVSKAQLLGFGLNFQHVGSMVFSGFNDSFEAFYQAVRRAYRFGQTRRLQVHLPYIPELEEAMLRNVLRKSAQFEDLIQAQEAAYVGARAELLERIAA